MLLTLRIFTRTVYFLFLQLIGAADGDIQSILLNDDVYPLLEEVGYQGVPGRETNSSIKSLIEHILYKKRCTCYVHLFLIYST